MSKMLTKEEFIAKAREIHGTFYDYSKVEYNGNKIKVCIICPVHGEFWQVPNTHLNGSGCKKCSYESRVTRVCNSTEWFIGKARSVHGGKYNYLKTIYSGASEDVLITCPIHGDFYQKATTHLKGSGCPKCALEARKMTTVDFFKRCREVHGDKYDYSLTIYTDIQEKVKIICPIHGVFEQIANSHLRGQGCVKCCHEGRRHPIFGVGINDYEENIVDENGNIKYFYSVWHSMIRRCYSENHQKVGPSYIGCTVCEEWKYLSKFKEWFDKNYVDGCHLDKDILVQDNRIYSPQTCCFVPQYINSLLTDHRAARGKYMLGVVKSKNGFTACVNRDGKSVHLGTFDTETEAHNAYVKAKKEIIKNTAERALANGTIKQEVYDALLNRNIKEY